MRDTVTLTQATASNVFSDYRDHFVTRDVTQIIMDLPVLWNATVTVKIVLVMTLLVCVLWDVKRGSLETNVTDNVRVVRQGVID